MTAPVVIGAPAKLNLYLHVLARRDDGYHDLDSLVAFASLHDVVEVAPADGLSLTLDGPFAADLAIDVAEADNLVLRAARLLQAHVGAKRGAAIRLHKIIPLASGLGGGSADAAATMLALCRLWHAEVPLAALSDLSLDLGADVPVCLASRTAFMAGIGERVVPAAEVPPLGLVLVNPRVTLPTASVFRALEPTLLERRERPHLPPGDAVSLITALRGCDNDLTAPAARLAPVVGQALALIAETPGILLSRMSGSGATCFGLYADGVAAQVAAESIAGAKPGWWVRAGRLIRGREELIDG